MAETIELAPPDEVGGVSLAKALARRRSVRAFAPRELDWKQIGQLLWAAQGVSDRVGGLRTAPSAGALFPLELEAGHAAQNLLLAAAAFGLGAAPVGAFQDEDMAQVLRLARDEMPLYLIPVGWPPGSR
jgi:nitroreductase